MAALHHAPIRLRPSWVAPLLTGLLLATAGCNGGGDEEECNGHGELHDDHCDCDDGYVRGEDETTCVEGDAEGGDLTFAPATVDGVVGAAQDGSAIWQIDALDGETLLGVEMYASYGAPTSPGTVELTGVETSYATCGTCLVLQTGCAAHDDHFHCDHTFMPSEGEVHFDAIGANVGDQLTGELHEVVFQEVTIGDDFETTPVEGGAELHLHEWAFDVTLGAM